MLILTKFIIKFIEIINITFTCGVSCIFLGLIFEKAFVHDQYQMLWLILWIPILLFNNHFYSGSILTANSCFNLICFYCLLNAKYYNLMIDQFKSVLSFGWKRIIMKSKFKYLFKQQNQFAIRIKKYNKFCRNFYLIMMINFIPLHMIYLQQILFVGHLNFYINLCYLVACFTATMFIIVSCSIVCLLDKQIKLYSEKLIQIQFNPYLKLDINIKLKVNRYLSN